MLACKGKLRVAPLPPPRGGAFDSPCAPRPSEGVGTKGVQEESTTPPAGRTKGTLKLEGSRAPPSPSGEGVMRSMTDEGGRAKRDVLSAQCRKAISATFSQGRAAPHPPGSAGHLLPLRERRGRLDSRLRGNDSRNCRSYLHALCSTRRRRGRIFWDALRPDPSRRRRRAGRVKSAAPWRRERSHAQLALCKRGWRAPTF
jgi:hypothetical protein